MNGYTFWIETYSGERTEWTRLSKTVALRMYAATGAATPDNVVRYGWDDCTEGYAEPVNERSKA
jgi:rhamnose utilization protein RhaD (predicted bifunctional aldolase and dehydrogenase)